MLQIAICDDEVTNILKVKELAELFFRTHCVEIRIEIYKSSDNLLYDMQDGQYFDLFLLDIEMPEVSGMDLLTFIQPHYCCRICYLYYYFQSNSGGIRYDRVHQYHHCFPDLPDPYS